METMLRDRRAALLLVGPALLIYSLIVLVPVVWSLAYTLFEGNVLSGFQFVGFHNFAVLVSDASFWQALAFTLKYAVVVTLGQVVIGLLLSLMYVFYLGKASGLVRTLIFFPVILPAVAIAQLFSKIFEIAPQYGLVNSLLQAVHANGLIQPWLGQGGSAFWVIVIMDIWTSMGFYAVLLFAGLVEIPGDILEGARVDGATGWRLVRYIVLPLLTPILFSSFIFSINGTLKVFASIVALTNGGPGQETTPLTLYMFNTAFSNGQYGYGSTIATALAIMSLLVTLLIFSSARRDVA
ncbi:MAG: sugar ABC transporter permease [Chloroflexi bacterium]|nr:MAG: sugar ABC transporter permease [Chloroflexota bacterium]